MTRARIGTAKKKRLIILASLILLAVLFLAAFAIWLLLPSANASFAISARTGSLAIDVLCGQRLVWDLPKGRVGSRSAPLGASPDGDGNATLVLTGGARVNLESTGPKVLRVAVRQVEEISRECKNTSPSVQISIGERRLADDPVGFTYVALATAEGDSSIPVSLPLSGRVVLGQPIQYGAGWTTRDSGILEGGTIMLRVVPWGSDERVTLDSEALDPGSQLDTHACLAQAAETPAVSTCSLLGEPAAVGFLRSLPSGGFSVQLYARGPVGLLPFGSAEQRRLTVPNSTAGWRSERVHVIGAFIILLAGLLGVIPKIKGEVYDPLRDWYAGTKAKPHGSHHKQQKPGEGLTDDAYQHEIVDGDVPNKRGTVSTLLLAASLASILCAFQPPSARAEPVEVRQGNLIGAGYSFRRGTTCHVVTALHVIPEIGVPVVVLDRTGARVDGSRSYKNDSYDLAVITLPDKHPVACTTSWPDTGWLRRASFPATSEFRAIRHYSGGKEVIVRLRYAGGDKDRLTLAPVDKLTVRESDSGTMVEFDGKLAGIVQSVDTATDYVSILRFDRIEDLVGDRFRSSAKGRIVKFAGVTWHGRENPAWSSYVQAWITEKVSPNVISASQSSGAVAAFNCEIKVDVVSWDRMPVSNPAYDSVQLQLKACGKKGFLYEQMCNAAKTASNTTPRQIESQKITLNATVIPTGSTPVTKLTTSTHVPQTNTLSKTEIELGSLQAAMGLTLPDMLAGGACN